MRETLDGPAMRFWWKQFKSDKAALKSAASEVFLVCLLSLTPLFLLPVIDQVRGPSGGNPGETNLFLSAISGGQLYIYSFALFGTLFWLTQKDYSNFRSFAPRKWFTLSVTLPMFVILLVYVYDPALKRPLDHNLILASAAIYFIYAILYYILTVFDNLKAPLVSEELEQGSDDLICRYKQNKTRLGEE